MKRLLGIAATAIVVGGAPVGGPGTVTVAAQLPADTLWRPLQRAMWQYRVVLAEDPVAPGTERWTTCADGAGLVRGRVTPPREWERFDRVTVSIHTVPEVPSPGRLPTLQCHVSSTNPVDRLDFAFAGVPPGTYRLLARAPGLAWAPVELRVAEGEELWATLPTREENEVDRCLRDDHCAPFLTRFSMIWPELDPESRRVVFLLRLAVAMSIGGDEEMRSWTVCLAEATPEALREIGIVARAAPFEVCGRGEIEYDSGYVGEGMVGPDGEPAIGIDHGWVYSYPDGTLGADVEFGHASEWAAGWQCRWREVDGIPVPVRCRATWIS